MMESVAFCGTVCHTVMPWRRGSLNVDDEGQPTQETVLIENGILKGYLSDKLSSKLMGIADTGNGRRESYEHIPMPRMTNTYMLPGNDDPQDIIRSVKHGIYAVNFGGGQVDITNGKFVFSASEAYMIEDGQVTFPIKGATLIGNGPDVLTRVSMVGNDLKLDEGVGTCGKDGQAVPVGVGIPTIKIDSLTVGGTARKEVGGFMTALNKKAAEVIAPANGQQQTANRESAIHSMTDVTGFGLIGHAREMALASNVSLQFFASRIPLLAGALECVQAGYIPGGLKANREFAECLVAYDDAVPEDIRTVLFDPQTAGGLLIAVASADAEHLHQALNQAGVSAVEIGEVLAPVKPTIRIVP